MSETSIYNEGARRLQDRFETRALADRVEQHAVRPQFTEADRALIEAAPFFFLATVDQQGLPQCSYKGGKPGFVRVIGPAEIAFPSFDGNGMYLSLGNVLDTGKVGMLFIDFGQAKRLRVNGLASVEETDPSRADLSAAQVVVRVRATQIITNCARHVHRMTLEALSRYTPGAGQEVGRMEWRDVYDDVLPERMRPSP
jgi:uncharacterized protein